jgi:hypothetical protein
MEEPPELVAVDRVVGGIEVEHDPLGRPGVGLEEEADEEVLDVASAADDLLVTVVLGGADGGQFEAVERALAGQCLAAIAGSFPGLAGGIGPANDGSQEGVASEVVVVVEVLVAQGQGVDALGDELLEGVLDEPGIAMVGEAAGELADDAGDLFGLLEQQGAAIGGDGTAVEVGEDLTGAEHGKVEVG